MSVNSRKMLLAAGFLNAVVPPGATLGAESALSATYNNLQDGDLIRVDDTTALLVGNGYNKTASASLLTIDANNDVDETFTLPLTGIPGVAGTYRPVRATRVLRIDNERFMAFFFSTNQTTVVGTLYSVILTVSGGTIAMGAVATHTNIIAKNGIGTSGNPAFNAILYDTDRVLVSTTAYATFNVSVYTISGTTISKGTAKSTQVTPPNIRAASEHIIVKTDTPDKYLFFCCTSGGGAYEFSAAVSNFDGATFTSTMTPAIAIPDFYMDVIKADTNLFLSRFSFIAFDGTAASKTNISPTLLAGPPAVLVKDGRLLSFETKLSDNKLFNVNTTAKTITLVDDNNITSSTVVPKAAAVLGADMDKVLVLGRENLGSYPTKAAVVVVS